MFTIPKTQESQEYPKKNECSHNFQHSGGRQLRQLIRKTPAENALQNPRAFFQFFNEMTCFRHTPRYKWIVVPRHRQTASDGFGWKDLWKTMAFAPKSGGLTQIKVGHPRNWRCPKHWGITKSELFSLWSLTLLYSKKLVSVGWILNSDHPKKGHTVGPQIMEPYGFVWKCWLNIPKQIAIFHRDNDQQNHWVLTIGYNGV